MDIGRLWYLKNQHGAERLWHGYLVQIVLTAKDDAVGRYHYVEIRNLAEQICGEIGPGADFRATVQRLCWMALERPTKGSSFKSNPGVSLLAAATHYNLLPLVERLLAEGHSPTSHNCLFAPAMQVAATDGNVDLLERFQQHLPEFEQHPGFSDWHGKIGPCSMVGAAIRGDLDVMRAAMYPPSRATPDSTDLLGQPFGSVSEGSPLLYQLLDVLHHTTSPAVFDYVRGIFAEPLSDDKLYQRMAIHAQRGNLEMVRHLLDMGVPFQSQGKIARLLDPPLVEACKGCHEEIVDLLLARGADPNYRAEVELLRPRKALPMAAKSGSLAIVRKLLDHGAYVNELRDYPGNVPAVWYALYLEHTAMVRLLLERGASLTGGAGTWFEGWIGPTALEMAVDLGLESMDELLRQNGVTLEPLEIRSERSFWKQFQLWAYDNRY